MKTLTATTTPSIFMSYVTKMILKLFQQYVIVK
jgi:hypothetical protein